MLHIQADFSKKAGKMKPMHCVNNGPVYRLRSAEELHKEVCEGAPNQNNGNFEPYKALCIPYARTHDAAFESVYGGEHTVDVANIFPDFSKDPYDENSYDFIMTDAYLRVIEMAGTKVFYRLGAKIEHGIKKYNTLPPADFKKWAIICEHIIRHYNYGWADGYHMGIEYWEIWNEADGGTETWGGTREQYYEFHNIVAEHLKQNFPELKIGGPAVSYLEHREWLDGFFDHLRVPLDFFSWHNYRRDPNVFLHYIREAKKLLEEKGQPQAESILNEWNYVKGWCGDDWAESLRTEKSLKGAIYVGSCICASQYEPLDMLMYYDARPCGMNGMFGTDFYEPLKGYYVFQMFNELYQLGTAAEVQRDDDRLFACAAMSENEAAIMVNYFDDEEKEANQDVCIDLKHLGITGAANAAFYCLDANHDATLVREEKTQASDLKLYVQMPLFSSYLIKITKED